MKYSLGNKIGELRLHKQLTLEQLAQLCKVSSAAISKWEHDLSYPDITLLPILARIFHVRTDELINFESEPREEENVEMTKKALEMNQSVPFSAETDCCLQIYNLHGSYGIKVPIRHCVPL